MGIDIRQTVRGNARRVSFEKIARSILGKEYALSVVLSGDTLARTINKKYRKKDYSPNVLSFLLDTNEGEIFLNVRKAAREARALGISLNERVAFLFIHGCLHLAGYKHGEKMEELEQKTLRRFGYSAK